MAAAQGSGDGGPAFEDAFDIDKVLSDLSESEDAGEHCGSGSGMKVPDKAVTILVALCRPTIIDPADTFLARVSSRFDVALRNTFQDRRVQAAVLVVWAFGAVFVTLGLVKVGEIHVPWTNILSSSITSFACLAPLLFSLICSIDRFFRLLRTFESLYLFTNVTIYLITVSSTRNDMRPEVIIYLALSFGLAIALDAVPRTFRNAWIFRYGLTMGTFMATAILVLIVFSRDTGGLFEDKVFHVLFLGDVSLLKRFAIGPLAVLSIFLAKNAFRKFFYNDQMMLMSTKVTELKFANKEALKAFFSSEYEKLHSKIAIFRSQTSVRQRDGQIWFLRPTFKTIIVDSRATMWNYFFGPRAGQSLWEFCTNWAVVRVCAGIHFASCVIILMTLSGSVQKQAILFVIPGSFPAWIFLGLINVQKARLLFQTFVPAYLVGISIVFCVGTCFLFSDIRSVAVIHMLPSLLNSALVDAHNRTLRKSGILSLALTATWLFCIVWMLIMLTGFGRDLTMFKFELHGAISSISLVQLMVAYPAAQLLPYLTLFTFFSVMQPDKLVSLRAPLEEVVCENAKAAHAFLGVRALSAMRWASASSETSRLGSSYNNKVVPASLVSSEKYEQ